MLRALALLAVSAYAEPFVVQIIDKDSGRGVPLVELRAFGNVSFYTDSAGIAAIDDPVYMGQRVLFEVHSHGYEYEGRVLGNKPQVAFTLKPGGREQIKIRRANIAERLYRITGGGIYADSVAAGLPVPIKQPLLNAGVLGQDTADAIPYRGKIFWIWGDTLLPAGFNFSVSGATSLLPGKGGLDPATGIDFDYFSNAEGRSRAMLPLPRKGLVWIEGLFIVRDHLLATYTRQQGLVPPDECGVALFDDTKQVFEPWIERPCVHGHVSAHPFLHTVNGREYWYLYPAQRVPNDWDAVRDPNQWEAFTCIKDGAVVNLKEPQLERGEDGRLLWRWRGGAARFDARDERRLLSSGLMKPDEARFGLIDVDTGKPSLASASAVMWSAYRKRWILLAEHSGEVFYSEAAEPEGPWPKAIRVVNHNVYNFYNVVMHPFFTQEEGRAIYFEGTYTDTFTNAKNITPRYNYNQIMYRLRLDDPRLNLP